MKAFERDYLSTSFINATNLVLISVVFCGCKQPNKNNGLLSEEEPSAVRAGFWGREFPQYYL